MAQSIAVYRRTGTHKFRRVGTFNPSRENWEQFNKRIARRALLGRILAGAIAGGLLALLVVGLDRSAQAHAAERDADTFPVTAPRVCAAVAVYTQATADDWAQRAVIARAWLNRAKTHPVADCRPGLTRALSSNFSPIRWQQALDAVDAVTSGSYAIPLACARVNTVLPPVARSGSPLLQTGARAQCIIRDLAFVEVRP